MNENANQNNMSANNNNNNNNNNNGGGQHQPGNHGVNFFSNIGTPSFNLSQLPQQFLQSLTQSQIQMIQQKHQQLLMSRIQQQQQQQQDQSSPMNQHPQMNMQQQQRSPSLGSQAGQQQMRTNPTNPMNTMPPQQQQQPIRPNSSSTGTPTLNNDNNINTAIPQASSQGSPAATNPQFPVTLPLQIAQLPLPAQHHVLQGLKQQAMAKNNPAVAAAITMAQQQVLQQIQQQRQKQAMLKQQQNVNTTGTPQPTTMTTGAPPLPQQMQNQTQFVPPNLTQKQAQQLKAKPKQRPKQSKQQPQQPIPNSNMNPTVPTPSLPFVSQLPTLPQFPPLPKFQTIPFDPPEAKLPTETYWSSQTPNEAKTETLLYEQLIHRDKLNKISQEKMKQGYEPISVHGLSNQEYITKLWSQLRYYQDLKTTRMKSITNTSKGIATASIWGDGYSGYGNGVTNTATKIISNNTGTKTATANKKRKYGSDDLWKFYEQAMNETSEDLVPLRLEFDHEKDKFFLRDTLLWNKNDQLIDLNEFVDDMMKDYKFDPALRDKFGTSVLNSIKEQLQEFQANPYLSKRKLGGDDLRIRIKLDIIVGQNQLIDQFEWDISNPDNSPEEFAECLCQELELPGEFVTAISHSIREQVHMYHKSLAILGYNFDGSPITDDDIRSRMLPVVTVDDIYRPAADTKIFTPTLIQISSAELERLDKDKDRDTRRKRRQGRSNRRGAVMTNTNSSMNLLNDMTNLSNSSINMSGNMNNSTIGGNNSNSVPMEILLPDVADIPRTFRTPVPSTIFPGGIDMGPSVYSYDLKTTVEYKSRPQPQMPPCYIVDNVPGKLLLISITLPKSKPKLDDTQETGKSADKNILDSHKSVAAKNVKLEGITIQKDGTQEQKQDEKTRRSTTDPQLPEGQAGKSDVSTDKTSLPAPLPEPIPPASLPLQKPTDPNSPTTQ
ncbi:hypothetical protein NCAS_0A04860 [Naumovozyma castellii]|uniref:Uncharacterized protein n=1 Tax=Naumovozyma castellii TaxID=27288 RepID=G0V6F2_NAUCA|nr:hypothetical protein NCAS_0A04860 [Naumovozyma castellii CBS 4309]CCC67044.1 hypothetical protein NCAS_0A04860 [Naumovozyma castellii CBS 4309]